MKKLSLLLLLASYGIAYEYTMHGQIKKLIPEDKSRSLTLQERDIIFFRDEQQRLVGVTKKIIIKFRENADKEAIYSQINAKELSTLGKNIYLISIDSSNETLFTCKTLSDMKEVEFAHPDFVYEKQKKSTEPLYNELWHLQNNGQFGGTNGADINITGAWAITKGQDIKIAIIDDGFDTQHEDLKDAIIAQKDFDYNDDDASYANTYDHHGTLCAGLAVARENGKGVVGVAPKSSMIAIKLGGKDSNNESIMVSDSQIMSAFLWADEKSADLVSCSWGTYGVSDGVKAVLDSLAVTGRGGKGLPVFFASGNDGKGQSAWAQDESALDSVIAVGASTDSNERAWYSNYGPKLDIVAPSGDGYIGGHGLATTDLTGDIGYVSNATSHPNYALASDDTGFHGTSASTPVAAGSAALLLSINPDLTRDQVKSILESTADKIGPDAYVNGRNDYFGAGKINAGKAVKQAQSLSSMTQTIEVKAGIWNLLSLTANQPITNIEETFGSQTWRIYAWDNATSKWKIWASDRSCTTIKAAGLSCLESINPGEGVFVANYGAAGGNTIHLQGGKSFTTFPTIAKGWNLIGLGLTTTYAQLKQTYGNSIVVWKMVNGSYIKVLDDSTTIEAGNGFWIKLI